MRALNALGKLFQTVFHPRNSLPCVGLVVMGGSLTFLIAPDELPPVPPDVLIEGLPTVVVDAGHGGRDNGGRGNGLIEKDLTLDLAFRTEKLLKIAGFPTVLTRTDDSYVSLEERARVANEHPDSLFVSIHLNKDGASASSGIESFYAKQKIPLQDAWTWIGFFSRPEQAENPEDGEHLAGSIQAAVANRTEGRNRGVRARDYYVVRHVRGPAVLVEAGFMSNPFEAQLLQGEEYRERIAMGIAEGIMGYQKSKGRPARALPQVAMRDR
jgi:N-acetylmuramoyl-L-alanine amidase